MSAKNILIYNKEDPRLNISFVDKDQAEKSMGKDPLDYVDFDKLDYGIYVDKKPDGVARDVTDKFLPLSVLSINDFEGAKEYYRGKYPTLPEEYWEIMAKYHISGGQGYQKKQLKNEMKRMKKGKKSEIEGLKIIRNKVIIDFD